jgi:hypothetical protein
MLELREEDESSDDELEMAHDKEDQGYKNTLSQL